MSKYGHNSNTRGSSWLTRSYNFIDKDPECDRFRTLFQKEHIKESDLAVLAGLAVSTVNKMFGGETRRPQHATFAKMAGALGFKYDLVRETRPDYDKAIPKAQAEFKDYKASLARKREREERRQQKRGVS